MTSQLNIIIKSLYCWYLLFNLMIHWDAKLQHFHRQVVLQIYDEWRRWLELPGELPQIVWGTDAPTWWVSEAAGDDLWLMEASGWEDDGYICGNAI